MKDSAINTRVFILGMMLVFCLGFILANKSVDFVWQTFATWQNIEIYERGQFVALSVATFFVIVLLFFPWLLKHISKIRHAGVYWSWNLIIIHAVIGGFLASTIVQIPSFPSSFSWFSLALIWFELTIITFHVRPFNENEYSKNWVFAPGSVGCSDDRLSFATAAKSLAFQIANLKEYVSVIGIQGDMGHGKSSYLRMVMESCTEEGGPILDPDKTLYTYLSLTETNKAEDLSMLFAEKWRDTLSDRYIVYNYKPLITALSPLIGAMGKNGLYQATWSAISNFIDQIPCLYLTKTKVSDNYTEPGLFVDNKVAGMFFHIPEIKENKWIIVLDELERAPLDELFRLAETVERLKNLGRAGFPVKIVLILCFAMERLQERLEDTFMYPNVHTENMYSSQNKTSIGTSLASETVDGSDERKKLLYDFFFLQKTFNLLEWLPPPSSEIKKQFVVRDILDGFREIDLTPDTPFDGKFDENEFYNQSKTFLKNDFIIPFLIKLLEKESLRFIRRLVMQVQNRYMLAKRSVASDEFNVNAIRSGDILIAEYLKLKYPMVWEAIIGYSKNGKDIHRHIEFAERAYGGPREISQLISCSFYSENLNLDPVEAQRSLYLLKNLRAYLKNEWPLASSNTALEVDKEDHPTPNQLTPR